MLGAKLGPLGYPVAQKDFFSTLGFPQVVKSLTGRFLSSLSPKIKSPTSCHTHLSFHSRQDLLRLHVHWPFCLAY